MREFFTDHYDMQGLFAVPASMVAPRPYRGFEYLYSFYLLPWEVIGATRLKDMPRNPLQVIMDDYWRRTYTSDYFKEVISRGWGKLLWPYLGIPGRMDDYAADSFFYTVATSYLNWFMVLGKLGYHPRNLTAANNGSTFIFCPYDDVVGLAGKMVDAFKTESQFEEIRDIYLQYPDFDDFEQKRKSRVRVDHYRKYYHTRTKVGIMEPLEYHPDAGETIDPKDDIISRVDFDRFKNTLSEKDRAIVELLEQDYTQKDIAQALGYANHSGISKKIKTIAEKYLSFTDEQQGRRDFLSGDNV
ncbi:MAG: hypothetical protein VB081_00870 [Christensenella sp.]|uniref:RNA polymerase sigma factor n=1 Tax=Christensenella sp. TaxID=1935934 RepID=UPI002B217292|nr:hypothetical protein [Christensenella sp.]MEA5002042.1 hypothetical protein [Christensenella sp.]